MSEIVELADTLRAQRLAEVEKKPQGKDQTSEVVQIHSISPHLRSNPNFVKYCSPKFLSFGPIHHDRENLTEGEEYKKKWATKFLAKIHIDHAADVLLKRVEDNIGLLKNLYSAKARRRFNDEDLSWMLLVDGCSLLFFMEMLNDLEELELKFHQAIDFCMDVIMLENQLPTKLLQLLSKENGKDIHILFTNCFCIGAAVEFGMQYRHADNPNPVHLLDFIRSMSLSPLEIIVGDTSTFKEDLPDLDSGNVHVYSNFDRLTFKNIQDLRTAGIEVRPSKMANWNDIHFSSKYWFRGELKLPRMLFNAMTPYKLWNFIAYELCPGSKCEYECCSFLAFLDSLIDSAEDVKEMRLAGVFQNQLGCDEDVATLFNEMATILPPKYSPKSFTPFVRLNKRYWSFNQKIERHYKNKWRTSVSEIHSKYFKNPLTIIGLCVGVTVLILSFIQTWFTVYSK